jgi:excisionase family DNA binding protein
MPEPERIADESSARCVSCANEWLSTEDVADYLKVPARTVRAWKVRGVGPLAHKVGRHVRYQRRDVTEWVTSGASARTGSDPQPEPVRSLIRAPRALRRR